MIKFIRCLLETCRQSLVQCVQGLDGISNGATAIRADALRTSAQSRHFPKSLARR